ncbi:death-associated inhibitor of apoptosis 1-like isoform X2 [Tribolium madens]|nr:death-associated inhibitor of apoptosis 1-like isoform X2 [Tribolium madens]XP_044259806.1 death-associated inhibitor of apoptosis 1-like isoform X2 [Tribolium madens]XP_044259807.1 death-associated inhibitor of apoptosis 1-like isoform X2 [Tribolium madens]
MVDTLSSNSDILRSMRKDSSHIINYHEPYKPHPPETKSSITEPDNGHKSETLSSRLDFSKEADRLSTFIDWKSDAVTPEALAKAGFYFLNNPSKPDLVKCAFCKAEICSWEQGDNALSEHMKWSPNCPFAKEKSQNLRVPAQGQDVCGNVEIFPNSVPESETFRMLRTMIRPYEDKKARLESFATWPSSSKQNPETLADAGFYYRGVEDHTICFTCGGALQAWKEEDDPWEEHAKWYPRCPFLVASKGQEYIKQVQIKKPGASSSNVTKENEKSTEKMSECGAASEDGVILCKICDRFERNTVFLPCKHIVACTQCSDVMQNCPICRRNIENKIKVYIS